MRKIFSLFFLLLTSVGSFADGGVLTDVEQFSVTAVHTTSTFTANYFSHNSPSIQEYLEGKARVGGVINKILGYGFEPKVVSLEIGIAPQTMSGGNVVEQGGKLYVSITSSDGEIEGGLLRYFFISIEEGQFTFFSHNSASIDQLRSGKAKVERAIARFSRNGLNLVFPNPLEIGIAPVTMSGGNIVEQEGKIYISVTSTDDELERYFIKYVQE